MLTIKECLSETVETVKETVLNVNRVCSKRSQQTERSSVSATLQRRERSESDSPETQLKISLLPVSLSLSLSHTQTRYNLHLCYNLCLYML